MSYLDKFKETMEAVSFGNGESYGQNMDGLVGTFLRVRKEDCAVYFIGNGGSAGIAVHMTADFLKNGRMRAVSLYNTSTLTCLANDYGYEQVFSRQINMLARRGDLLVAISSSGESANILEAAKAARERGCVIVTLTGFRPDNSLRRTGDRNIYVPSGEYGIVESIHNLILQQAVDEILAHDRQ